MTEGPPSSRPEAEVIDSLLRSADLLLKKGAELDAVHVLHAEIVQAAAGRVGASLPSAYASRSEARRQQARLLAEWRGTAASRQAQGALRNLLARRPVWVTRAALVAVLTGLTLRYVWAVSDQRDWDRQHPEGNWISRFYPKADFQGLPLVRYDVGVNSDFAAGAPAKAMSKDQFSARWDTCLVVAQDVELTLNLKSDDGSTLFLDGVPQIEIVPGPGEKSAPVLLRQGQRHLRVEFQEKDGMALVRLEGLEIAETAAYRFRRPLIDGEDVRCP